MTYLVGACRDIFGRILVYIAQAPRQGILYSPGTSRKTAPLDVQIALYDFCLSTIIANKLIGFLFLSSIFEFLFFDHLFFFNFLFALAILEFLFSFVFRPSEQGIFVVMKALDGTCVEWNNGRVYII